jgi:hypothetical protein
MKGLKFLLLLLLFGLTIGTHSANAQCSVCSTTVETNKKAGGTQADGLNHGIMYLLAAPYLAIAAVGYLWYKKYRRKNVSLNMRNEKLNLN